MSEFANSGSYSESGYGMVWNAFKPSKTSLGSSGGSAVAVATSLAGFGMGSPDRRVALRAEHRRVAGDAARHGRHRLRRGRDAADVAAGLRGPDGAHHLRHRPHPQRHHRHRPGRPRSRCTTTRARSGRPTGRRRSTPARCRASGSATCRRRSPAARATARPTARWKRSLARFADIEAAGATMVALTTQPAERPGHGPTLTGNRDGGGLAAVLRPARESAVHDGGGILSSPKVLPYNRQTVAVRPRMTAEDNQKMLVARDEYKDRIKTWMDEQRRRRRRLPGLPLATSTTTTAPRRCRAIATAAC